MTQGDGCAYSLEKLAETHRLYWQVQYERVAQHENGRYQVSSFVIAGSLVTLGFVTQLASSSWDRWVAAIAVLLVNLLAVVFIATERRWVKIHQARAAAVLELLSPDLVRMQDEANLSGGVATKSSTRNALARSANVLAAMHVLAGMATIMLAVSA